MGVDFYTCDKCGETFPDCGPCGWCDSGHAFCGYCVDKESRDEEGLITDKTCSLCQVGGSEIERLRKLRSAVLSTEYSKTIMLGSESLYDIARRALEDEG